MKFTAVSAALCSLCLAVSVQAAPPPQAGGNPPPQAYQNNGHQNGKQADKQFRKDLKKADKQFQKEQKQRAKQERRSVDYVNRNAKHGDNVEMQGRIVKRLDDGRYLFRDGAGREIPCRIDEAKARDHMKRGDTIVISARVDRSAAVALSVLDILLH